MILTKEVVNKFLSDNYDIKCLNLSFENITEIKDNAFENLVNFKVLCLGSNQVTQIKIDGLIDLSYLFLSDNFIFLISY